MTNSELRKLKQAVIDREHVAIIGAPSPGKTVKKDGTTVDEMICQVSRSEALTGRSETWYTALLPGETITKFQARMDSAVEARMQAEDEEYLADQMSDGRYLDDEN